MTPVLLNGEPGMDKLRNNSIVKKKFLETGSAFIYISFISDEECRAIYFITGRGTRKFRNISVNPSVSLLVSTAEGRSSGFSEAAAITITGTASIIEGTPGEEILKRYSEKLPFLKEFLNFHDCAMIKVNVSGYLLVKNFQDTYEYEF